MTSGARLELQIRHPLDRFELDVALASEARVLGVFGPSGAGKSSLVESLAGVRRPRQAEIAFAGEVWQSGARFVPPERRGVGWVPQGGGLFPHLDVRGNLGSGRNASAVDELAAALELDGLLDRSIESLSGGEIQRVALGRALATAPRLLLLDEPLSALDHPLRRRITAWLRCARTRWPGMTVIVSHEPSVLLALADEVAVVRDGRVVRVGAPLAALSAEAGDEFENVLPGRVTAASGDEVRVELAAGIELSARAPRAAAIGTETLVGIRASEVILAAEPVRGISARNLLPGRIVGIAEAGQRHLVEIDLGGPLLVAEVTARALAELALAPQRNVHVILKSSGCRLFE